MHALDHVQAQKPISTTWVAVRRFSNLLITKLHLVVVRRFEKLPKATQVMPMGF